MATDDQKKRQALRDDDTMTGDAAVLAYKDEDGNPRAWQGDEEMPWVRAFIDGGVVAANVQGLIAHDEPDDEATNFPVKVGGHATSGIRTAVDADDDIADVSVDLNGRVRTRVSGTNESTNVPADVRLDSANALEVGGQAEHGEADKGFPLLGGMHANISPASAVTENDRARASGDLRGRYRVRVSGEANGAGVDVETNSMSAIVPADMMLAVCDPGSGLFGPLPADVEQLTAAANTSDSSAALTAGRIYELRAVTDVRFRLGSGATTAVATDRLLIAGDVYRWLVSATNNVVAVINVDVTSEAHVYPVSFP